MPAFRRLRALARLGAGVLLASGCVYYNGIYNAKETARSGDHRLRQGSEGDAEPLFQQSAAKAESVLVRYPKSKWRTRALYLAGRGEALGGQCEPAVPRLTEFLRQPGSTAADVDRARLALASCDLRLGRVTLARVRLDSLVDVADAETARQARRWAARAALTAGDRDAVAMYLGQSGDAAMPWELMFASLAAQESVRAESLLVERAVRGEYRDDVPRALRELWNAGRFEGVERVVQAYDRARIRDASRASMHFTVGDLSLRAGRDSLARQHLSSARTLAARDTVIAREAAARLAFMALVRASTLREADTVMAREDSAVRRTVFARRLDDHLLLVRLLAREEEPTGASLFLAAEVARDSLQALALARALFLRVAREMPGAPLAPQALYAASLLAPDSAAAWQARIRSEFPNSAVAAWLRGDDPGARPDFTSAPALLRVRWDETVRVWADSVKKLRTPPRSTTPSSTRN